ncbi:MAG TPA: hypothetical protein HA345_01455 [Candidatus Thalassarchaeaceae archaeon]|nr:MAG TPA: hypothetical protein D7H94_01445 [Candidatus Poseidoniales archaeon]HIH84054.1 hypothetical protein [Candidatus Thalassarchaeaceae archaeon]
MHLHWDWRLARVVDAEGVIIDESVWDGVRSSGLVADRIEMVRRKRMTPEARDIFERFPEVDFSSINPESWPPFTSEEMSLLDQASIILARRGLEESAGDVDRRMEHLVHAVEEMRISWTTMESRVVEWVGLFLTGIDLDEQRRNIVTEAAASSSFEDLLQRLATDSPQHSPTDEEWVAIQGASSSAVEMSGRIKDAELAIRIHAESHIPSLSALLGPLLAARMTVAAHGRARLSRLPSSTVQVLGAEKAFFAHLRTGSPPPKHGMIFQHPWISRSPRWVRGKISRLVAGKASIAVRVDEHGGKAWGDEEIAAIERAVQAVRSRHPKPPSKRRR